MRIAEFGEQALGGQPGLDVLAQREKERAVGHDTLAVTREHEVDPQARSVRPGSAASNEGDAGGDQRVVGRHLDGERGIAIGVARGV